MREGDFPLFYRHNQRLDKVRFNRRGYAYRGHSQAVLRQTVKYRVTYSSGVQPNQSVMVAPRCLHDPRLYERPFYLIKPLKADHVPAFYVPHRQDGPVNVLGYIHAHHIQPTGSRWLKFSLYAVSKIAENL